MLSVSSLALLSLLSLVLSFGNILVLLFWNEGGSDHLNSVALLLILIIALLFLPYTFFLYILFLCLFLLYIFFMPTSWRPTLLLQVSFLSYCIKLSLQIYVWLQVYTAGWLFVPHCILFFCLSYLVYLFTCSAFTLFLITQNRMYFYTVVNTNSKYKEDDFTDSDAVDYSQDVCICFRHEALTCHPRSFVPPSPLYTSQPGSQPETLKTITTPSQPWILHDGDSDTKIDADSACI